MFDYSFYSYLISYLCTLSYLVFISINSWTAASYFLSILMTLLVIAFNYLLAVIFSFFLLSIILSAIILDIRFFLLISNNFIGSISNYNNLFDQFITPLLFRLFYLHEASAIHYYTIQVYLYIKSLRLKLFAFICYDY